MTIMDIIEKKLNKCENVMIVAVGDSITHGECHCTNEQTFCAVLARLVGKRFPENKVLRYDGIVEAGAMPLKGFDGPITVQEGNKPLITLVRNGVGGDTVRRTLNRSGDYVGEFINGERPDVFLLMHGINDALANDPSKYVLPDTYYNDLKELYTLLKTENPEAEIVFMTPTYNDSGLSEKSCLEPYVEQMKILAAETNTRLIDTHKLWMEHLVVGSENHGQRDWLSNVTWDGCHYSPVGGEETAKFIFKCLCEI